MATQVKLLAHAVSLLKDGDRRRGRHLLLEIIKDNRKNDLAWAWLYTCVDSDEERVFCLEKFLDLNPYHAKAKEELKRLTFNRKTDVKLEAENLLDQKKYTQSLLLQCDGEIEPEKKAAKGKRRPVDEPEFGPHYRAPTRITRAAGENMFTRNGFRLNDFPDADAGVFDGYKFQLLSIGGLYINSQDFPACVERGKSLPKSYCYMCEFFSAADCPLRRDADLVRELKVLFTQRRTRQKEYVENQTAVVDALYDELKAHGRPLHYEVLTQIIKDRYPKLQLNPRIASHLMSRHKDYFEKVSRGVYQAK
jgi:hypothetical protein